MAWLRALAKPLVGLGKWGPWFHTEPSKAMTETQTSWHSIHLGSALASPLCTGGPFSFWWSQMRWLKGKYTGWDQGDGHWGWEQNVNSITSPTAELNISSAQPTFAKHWLCARYLWTKVSMRCGPCPWKIHMGVWKMAISVLSEKRLWHSYLCLVFAMLGTQHLSKRHLLRNISALGMSPVPISSVLLTLLHLQPSFKWAV